MLSKRAALISGGIVFGALVPVVYYIYVIGVVSNLWQPLARPVGVSSRARHVSSIENEAWFDCWVDRSRDVDVCKAWDGYGRLIAVGNYRLDGENRAASEKELIPYLVIGGARGRPDLAWIYLSEARGPLLVPVNDAGQPLDRFEVKLGTESR